MKANAAIQQIQHIASLGLGDRVTIPVMLEEIKKIVPSAISSFAWYDGDGRPVDVYIPELIPSAIQALAAPAADRGGKPSYSLANANVLNWKLEIGNARNFRRTGRYDFAQHDDAVLKAYGLSGELDMPIRRMGKTVGTVAFLREPNARDFTAAEQRMLLSLRPYFVHALDKVPTGDARDFVLDDTEVPRGAPYASATVLVSRTGEIVLASPQANALIVALTDVNIDGVTQPRVFGPKIPLLLWQLLDRLNAIEAGFVAAPPRFTRKTSRGMISVRAYDLANLDGSRGDLVTMVLDAYRPREISLVQQFGSMDLTPAERRVAVEMAIGRPMDESLSRLGIKRQTWYDYTKRIYRSMGVSGRSEFLRKVH